jgi:type I restriction enzyme R subunit
MSLNEAALSEEPALEVFKHLGYEYKKGSEIGPNAEDPERESFSDVVLRDRLKKKLREFNPKIPEEGIESAVSQLLGFNSPRLLKSNKNFHEKVSQGVQVEFKIDGEERGGFVDIINFEKPDANDFLVSNQFTIQVGEDNPKRRPDILIFVNGLPIGIIENKDPTNPNATIETAYKQVTDRYVNDIPDLFHYNELIAVMDMGNAELGCLSAGLEWFSPWRYIHEEVDATQELPPFEVLIRGAFEPKRLLDLIRHFILFSDEDGQLSKKLAAYHQFYAVNNAVENSKEVVLNPDDNRIGVVWHTQGSGKSLSMVFYANKVRQVRDMENPTLVFLTDRNDLDEQLFKTFKQHGLPAEWADNDDRIQLRERLNREAGGIIFSTIQKFQTTDDEAEYPEVNDRQNMIVVADEAHRTQYKELAANVRAALPNASYLGFTATPIEKEDRSTINTFGGYISQYTIEQSEKDESTVPIYYESRLAKLQINDTRINEHFEELMESASDDLKNHMKKKWTSLRRIIENSDERTNEIAKDIVEHFNNRDLRGKGMIVAISREAAVQYKRAIEKIPGAPEVEVVISDPEEYIDDPDSHEQLKHRFKDPDDSLKLAVVCDMWLTGFDVPCLHTMYVDKPMKNHNLLQAIGRVNRVWKDKPGGLIVDYIGIGDNLKKALDKYTTEVQESAMLDLEKAVEVMYDKHEKVADFFAHIEYDDWAELESLERTQLLHKAQNEVLVTEEREQKFKEAVAELNKAYTLVTPRQEANEIRSDVVFFRAVKDSIQKMENSGRKRPPEELDSAMKELSTSGKKKNRCSVRSSWGKSTR